mgnify:CR=1 FL=1
MDNLDSTVNKLIILYIFDAIEMPLAEDSIVDICYYDLKCMQYIDCKEAIANLLDAGLIVDADVPKIDVKAFAINLKAQLDEEIEAMRQRLSDKPLVINTEVEAKARDYDHISSLFNINVSNFESVRTGLAGASRFVRYRHHYITSTESAADAKSCAHAATDALQSCSIHRHTLYRRTVGNGKESCLLGCIQDHLARVDSYQDFIARCLIATNNTTGSKLTDGGYNARKLRRSRNTESKPVYPGFTGTHGLRKGKNKLADGCSHHTSLGCC